MFTKSAKTDEANLKLRQLAQSVPFLILHSTRPDKYGRYLADLFYKSGDEEKFLNQELLDQHHAVRMQLPFSQTFQKCQQCWRIFFLGTPPEVTIVLTNQPSLNMMALHFKRLLTPGKARDVMIKRRCFFSVLLLILALVLQPRIASAVDSFPNNPPVPSSQQQGFSLEEALKKDPKNEELYYYAMSIFWGKKRYEDVIRLATSAKRENVLSSRILKMVSLAFFLTGDYYNSLISLELLDLKLSGEA